MSKYLGLRLFSPFQSWGIGSQYNYRHTGEFPTKSGIYGIFCAAAGYDRGSEEEKALLKTLNQFHMTTFRMNHRAEQSVYTDYQIVQNTIQVDGKIKQSEVTYRDYLCDVSFGVILEGDDNTLQSVLKNLNSPVRTLFLGRKCCVPLNPFTIGIFSCEEEAVRKIIDAEPFIDKRNKPSSLESCAYQKEVSSFSEGTDTLHDVPISFSERIFASRRVLTRKPIVQFA